MVLKFNGDKADLSFAEKEIELSASLEWSVYVTTSEKKEFIGGVNGNRLSAVLGTFGEMVVLDLYDNTHLYDADKPKPLSFISVFRTATRNILMMPWPYQPEDFEIEEEQPSAPASEPVQEAT
jgi:hypothetical protein